MKLNHILVVDDDPSMLFIITHVLQNKKRKIVTASNGEEALALIKKRRKKEKFIAIITDYKMPKMNGYELILNLKDDPTPIIMVTGELNLGREVVESGMRDILPKPFEDNHLRSVINQIEQEALPTTAKEK